MGGFSNEENSTYNGKVRVSIADKEGAIKVAGIGSSVISDLQSRWGWNSYPLNCTIPSGTTISFGDKLVIECTVDEDQSVFKQVKYATNGVLVGEWPLMPSPFIHRANSYSVGDYFDFMLKNNNFVYSGTIWKITDPSGVTRSYPHSDGAIRLTKSGTYKIVAEIRNTPGSDVIMSVAAKIIVH